MNGDSRESRIVSTRRRFLIGTTSTFGAFGVAAAAVPFIASWQPSARARAAGAPVRYDVGKLEPGQMAVVAWRGRPIFLFRHTRESLDNLSRYLERLADPGSTRPQQPDWARNSTRSLRPEISVLTGLCTHLGCSPKLFAAAAPEPFDSEWLGGFHCPCHGSKFDLAGRVYKGVPAPSNLEVPPYYFETDSVVVVGEEQEPA